MANAIRGIVTSFRRSKRVQHTHQTIVKVEGDVDRATLAGADARWSGEGGIRLSGRVVAMHGRGRAVRVHWERGFPPQGIGSPVEFLVQEGQGPRRGPDRNRN